MFLNDDMFTWSFHLDDQKIKHEEKLKDLLKKQIIPNARYKTIEKAKNPIERFILENNLMPLITFENSDDVTITKEEVEKYQITRQYLIMGDIPMTMAESIWLSEVKSVELEHNGVQYNEKYPFLFLPKTTTFGQSFEISTKKFGWMCGEHYSAYYFLKREINKLKEKIDAYNVALDENFRN